MNAGRPDLLRQLTPAILPPGIERAPAQQDATGASFEDLFKRATGGEVESGLPVRIAKGAGVEVNDEQLARLAPVVDRLHAAGASHALIEIDGRLLKVDVLTREVRAEIHPSEGALVDGIDAFAAAGARGEEKSGPLGPPAGTMPPSLAALLASRDSQNEAA